MNRAVIGAGALMWAGATLLLSQWRKATRPTLADRLRPHSPGGTRRRERGGPFSIESLGEVLVPPLRSLGDHVARMFGVHEPLQSRLDRIHSPVGASAVRLRQMLVAGGCAAAGALVAALTRAAAPASALLVAGAPLLAFLVLEQRLARQSERWKQRLTVELPVVGEQLAMLLNAGYSLGSSLSRIAVRGTGCAARDLKRVINRVGQGLSVSQALREWADTAQTEAVSRLVGVLVLHTEGADLGRLVAVEARQARREVQRGTIEAIERRAQQVWVPVTFATLVPGVILLAVPFLSALDLFSKA
jgi:tight adherence protein C